MQYLLLDNTAQICVAEIKSFILLLGTNEIFASMNNGAMVLISDVDYKEIMLMRPIRTISPEHKNSKPP